MSASGIHPPGLETAYWMAAWGGLAASASFLFSVYRELPDWRVRYLRWRGKEVTAGDLAETEGYRSVPSRPVQETVLQAITFGTLAALWVWTGDFSGRKAEALRKLVEAVPIALLLLWSLRKPRGEVGAPPEQEPKKVAQHSWWSMLVLLGYAVLLWFDPLAREGKGLDVLLYVGGAIVLFGGLWLWQRFNTPAELREQLLPEIDVPTDAVLGFLAAVAIVLFLLVVFTTLAV